MVRGAHRVGAGVHRRSVHVQADALVHHIHDGVVRRGEHGVQHDARSQRSHRRGHHVQGQGEQRHRPQRPGRVPIAQIRRLGRRRRGFAQRQSESIVGGEGHHAVGRVPAEDRDDLRRQARFPTERVHAGDEAREQAGAAATGDDEDAFLHGDPGGWGHGAGRRRGGD